MLSRFFSSSCLILLSLSRCVCAKVVATENATALVIQNDRLFTRVDKASGAMDAIFLDGQNLLGTRSGSTGIFNLDCYCIPSGFWTPGSTQPTYELYAGTDSTGTSYAGIRMSDTYTPTGQVLEQYWFLRDGETGFHTFSRLAYYNETTPFLRNLQEFRTLFRPNSNIWTHLVTNERQYAPLPGAEAVANEVVVQDATWYLGNTPNDPYVQEEADYFTKYTFQDTWRNHDAHGMYADGSQIADNSTFGAWMVMNTRETYFGGPLHSDLIVDGIVYNYIVSNHHGDQTPNITNGFDRTFGPHFYYFNHFPAGTDLQVLREDAVKFANPEWSADFYDSIAKYVPNYVTSKQRTTWNLQVDLPKNAKNPIAVLAQNGVDFQDNVLDTKAYQYWAEINESGHATIPRVKTGTYRLTIYADGIFGQYIQDGVTVRAGKVDTTRVNWVEESQGVEIFRIGTPDKSSGEYRHGYEPDLTHPRHPEQYRIYWPVYDFVDDFPEGVTFKVGESDVAKDLNYVHWSVFGGYANTLRPEAYYGDGNVNNWTIVFDLEKSQFYQKQQATFTVQLAGAKTAAGNTDVYNASEPYSNLPYTVNVNGKDLAPWIIPYYQSSSCAVRSAVICYNVANKFTFDPALLKEGENKIVLSLPYNATDYESAVLPSSVYVQYDALRLEVSSGTKHGYKRAT
ncbi:polysaccharide lyase family 4 protein [Annulohypoxylon truncatum]|uniref:polysaccharide lyase family 4 protein n=1 Tax=Annulohypoxylon truncatum TaxID=327061 RepID=UPI00200883F4|nr:polysaccharide lyase family 4 protein [Annulohypoxylon truncatum]KAI1210963.1 polysaccharide lyase family 4 protein [Annulohypoxylon truncatum]